MLGELLPVTHSREQHKKAGGDKMKLKIGRHEYEITEKDEFMDNGACVQLTTQSKERNARWEKRPHPVLSKKAVKALSKYPRKERKNNYGEWVTIFSLDLSGKQPAGSNTKEGKKQ
jgi:hypothetical protein